MRMTVAFGMSCGGHLSPKMYDLTPPFTTHLRTPFSASLGPPFTYVIDTDVSSLIFKKLHGYKVCVTWW